MSQFIELIGDPRSNPKGWPIKKLPELATYSIGLTYKPENISEDGTIVLRSGNILNSKIVLTDVVRVNCPIKESIYVQKNDILMCSRNGSAALVGKVAQIKDLPEPMTYGAFMTVIRSEYSDFLYLYFQSGDFREQVSTGKSSTMNQITQNMLDKISVPFPDEDTRNKLSVILYQADKSEFDCLKSQFIEMFFKNTWKEKYLEDVVSEDCSLSYGIVQPGEGVEDGIPVVRPVDLVSDIVEPDCLKKTTVDIANSYKRTTLKGGELLLCVRGTTGLLSMASNRLYGGNVTRGIVPIWFKKDISKAFMFHQMKSDYVQTQIKENTYGTTLLQINIKDLRKIKVILPPEDLQLKFVSVAEQADKSESVIYMSIVSTC